MQINEINALVFDVFGTVVDWRMSIAREGKALAGRKDITHVDWLEFADEWRAGYGPSMNRVRQGELPWTRIDDLKAVRAQGLNTAFVSRPLEHGPHHEIDISPEDWIDVIADDLEDLALKMGT